MAQTKNCRPHSLSLSPEVPTPTYSTESKSRNQEIVVNGNLPFPGICLWLHCLPYILQLWAVEGEARESCGDSWPWLISEPEEFCLAMTSAWYLLLPLCNPYYQTWDCDWYSISWTHPLPSSDFEHRTHHVSMTMHASVHKHRCVVVVALCKGSPECTPSQCPFAERIQKDPKGTIFEHFVVLEYARRVPKCFKMSTF